MAHGDRGMRHPASAGHHDEGHGEGHHAMASLPLARSAAWVIGSFAVLVAALWLTDLRVPLRFTAGG